MTNLASRCLTYALPIGAAVLLAGSTGLAFGQGTAAQREACAPDAIRLCQDTIPDVAKTTACMKAHAAELSPACHRMFVAATGEPASARGRRRSARMAPAAPATNDGVNAGQLDVGQLNVGQLDAGQLDVPSLDERPTTAAEDRRNARRVVTRLCRNEILDADTCRLTQSAIDLAR